MYFHCTTKLKSLWSQLIQRLCICYRPPPPPPHTHTHIRYVVSSAPVFYWCIDLLTLATLFVQAWELWTHEDTTPNPSYIWMSDLVFVLATLTELVLKVGPSACTCVWPLCMCVASLHVCGLSCPQFTMYTRVYNHVFIIILRH